MANSNFTQTHIVTPFIPFNSGWLLWNFLFATKLTNTHTRLPWWSWDGCNGCCLRWHASTLRHQPAAVGGERFPLQRTPAWGSTSCPGRTIHTQTWGRLLDTCHSCPAMPCTCTGELGKDIAERGSKWSGRFEFYCGCTNISQRHMCFGVSQFLTTWLQPHLIWLYQVPLLRNRKPKSHHTSWLAYVPHCTFPLRSSSFVFLLKYNTGVFCSYFKINRDGLFLVKWADHLKLHTDHFFVCSGPRFPKITFPENDYNSNSFFLVTPNGYLLMTL